MYSNLNAIRKQDEFVKHYALTGVMNGEGQDGQLWGHLKVLEHTAYEHDNMYS